MGVRLRWRSVEGVVYLVDAPWRDGSWAVTRREGVADNVHGGLRVTVRCDVVGVSACDYYDGRCEALFIGLVRRGGTGRGRFTNRPYGLYGRAERPGVSLCRMRCGDLCVWVNRARCGER